MCKMKFSYRDLDHHSFVLHRKQFLKSLTMLFQALQCNGWIYGLQLTFTVFTSKLKQQARDKKYFPKINFKITQIINFTFINKIATFKARGLNQNYRQGLANMKSPYQSKLYPFLVNPINPSQEDKPKQLHLGNT